MRRAPPEGGSHGQSAHTVTSSGSGTANTAHTRLRKQHTWVQQDGPGLGRRSRGGKPRFRATENSTSPKQRAGCPRGPCTRSPGLCRLPTPPSPPAVRSSTVRLAAAPPRRLASRRSRTRTTSPAPRRPLFGRPQRFKPQERIGALGPAPTPSYCPENERIRHLRSDWCTFSLDPPPPGGRKPGFWGVDLEMSESRRAPARNPVPLRRLQATP